MQEAIHKLEDMFDSLVIDTQSELENTGVEYKALTQKVTLLPVRIRSLHKSFIKENIKYFGGNGEISDVFNTYWDYLNIDILEQIIEKFALISIYEGLQSFKQEQRNFMAQTTVTEFCETAQLCDLWVEPPMEFMQVISTHAWNSPVYLQEVNEFRRNLTFQIEQSIPELVVLLVGVNIGSVTITVFVPKASKNIVLATDEIFFRNNSIFEFEVDGTCIYYIEVSHQSC